jgi:16S rRNA (cytosine1407-C5)-methyltransferase
MIFPEDFLRQTKELFGEEAEALLVALEESSPVSIRLNPAKVKVNQGFPNVFQSFLEKVSWSSFGQYLKERPSFTFDPLLHAGCYYVQEASSMFVEQALCQAIRVLKKEDVCMLDLCAAPGGKSTLAASVLSEGSLLVANELIHTRANILAENMIKWGKANIVVTQSDSSAFSDLIDFFDIISTDVPCSGEGMFRKDPDSILEWSKNNVKQCACRQRDILTDCWPALRAGGCLIYSTCTYNRQENEDNVRWICEELGGTLLDIPVQEEWNISGAKEMTSDETVKVEIPVYRFLPYKTKGEGFFLALIQKNGDGQEKSFSERPSQMVGNNSYSKIKGNQGKHSASKIPDSVQSLLRNPDNFGFSFDRQGKIIALPKNQKTTIEKLEEKLRIIHAGIVIGEIKGKDLLPDVSLALSTELNAKSVQTCSLNLQQSIAYLRGETLVLPKLCPSGWILIIYEGYSLGWMKNIGNRANNAYPNRWRIRSENPY